MFGIWIEWLGVWDRVAIWVTLGIWDCLEIWDSVGVYNWFGIWDRLVRSLGISG